MATVEHCLFCFETLHAELNQRKALTLGEVEASYAAYVAQKKGSGKPQQVAGDAATAASLTPSSAGSSAAASTASLSNGSAASPATSVSTAPSAAPPAETPLFVTWNTIEDSIQDLDEEDADADDTEHILRGCIGTFESLPLEQGLATYALTAALEDTRFQPIGRRELRHLEVAVTLLTDFEVARGGVEDWELGKHGIRISFVHNGFQYGATYLPDVAVEQGWTKEQTLLNLMRKAGWSGRRDQWRKVNMRVVRYQGRKRRLTYRHFMDWREWADAQAATATAAAAE